jgi:hypothetical protein
MKNNPNYKSKLKVGKSKLYVLMGLLAFASISFASCNNNTNKGDATVQNDTSAAVTKRVDTVATDSGTKQP